MKQEPIKKRKFERRQLVDLYRKEGRDSKRVYDLILA